MKWPSVQCLTIDGIELSHEAQVLALCAAGAQWIQLRMKSATDDEVFEVATRCLPICRQAGVRLIMNDRIEVALRLGMDGVHLGKCDLPWAEARALAGADFLIGGTVNSVADAQRAIDCGALDYVGVGPFRFTRTKQNLAPVLTTAQWVEILQTLGAMPSYAIGGIVADDLADLRELGVRGVAIASGLFRGATVAENFQAHRRAWESETLSVGG